MGDLARALANAIAACPPQEDAFFTQLSGGELDLRDRIAAHLDAGLVESVIASEVRALGMCGSFGRLFDLLSQFVSRVSTYRWLAVYADGPDRLGIHAHPQISAAAEAEARVALDTPWGLAAVSVEDEDAFAEAEGEPAIVQPILLGTDTLGRIALGPRRLPDGLAPAGHDRELLRVVARELGGPLRIATLMAESQRLATEDSLTGLLNRRAFLQGLQREVDRLERQPSPLCLLLLDVDHFKSINDERGHPAGDAVLAQLGRLLGRSVRKPDLVGRWGGEEFVVALVGVAMAPGATGAERIREAISTMQVVDSRGNLIPVTASIGLTELVDGDTPHDLVARADQAMYLAKSSGRNRVVVAERPPANQAGGVDEGGEAPVPESLAS
jgi:diguanylate cyclase (GGDEF)-like protein